MNMPVWIISLNPSAPTVTTLSQSLNERGIAHEFIAAVDGRQKRPELLPNEHYNTRKSLLRHKRILTNSELGCYLAHYRAICRAYEAGHPRICILEDDVIPEPGLASVLEALEKTNDNIEMTRLMGLRIRKRKVTGPLTPAGHELVRPERGWCGAQGYVLNRQGMLKIIRHAADIFEPIDKVFDHFWEFDLNVFGVEPHVLYETEHTTSVSKANDPKLTIPLIMRLIAPIQKALFSRSRHTYLSHRAADFYPASMPQQKIGNTGRLR